MPSPRPPLARRGYVGLALGGTAPVGVIETGLVVRGVAPGSSAESAGLLAGDLLTHIERNPITDLEEARRILKALHAGAPLLLRVIRAGKALEVDTVVNAYPIEEHARARTLLGEVDVQGVRLRSVVVLPDGPGPHPVVYCLPSAHWASEEHPLEPEHPLFQLVGELARAGIGTVRVERSGVGDSEGPPCTRVDFEGEVSGFVAGFDELLRAPWVDPSRIALFGHSIGAMVAPLVARGRALSGVVTFGASAIPISEGLVGAILRHAELDARDPEGARKLAGRISEIIRGVVVEARTPAELFAARPDLGAISPSHFHDDEAYHRIVGFYHQLERVDLWGAWREVTAPCVVVHGTEDWITSAEDSRNLAAGIGVHARAVELPGVDHHMSDLPAGRGQRLAPALRELLVDWLRERLGR